MAVDDRDPAGVGGGRLVDVALQRVGRLFHPRAAEVQAGRDGGVAGCPGRLAREPADRRLRLAGERLPVVPSPKSPRRPVPGRSPPADGWRAPCRGARGRHVRVERAPRGSRSGEIHLPRACRRQVGACHVPAPRSTDQRPRRSPCGVSGHAGPPLDGCLVRGTRRAPGQSICGSAVSRRSRLAMVSSRRASVSVSRSSRRREAAISSCTAATADSASERAAETASSRSRRARRRSSSASARAARARSSACSARASASETAAWPALMDASVCSNSCCARESRDRASATRSLLRPRRSAIAKAWLVPGSPTVSR